MIDENRIVDAYASVESRDLEVEYAYFQALVGRIAALGRLHDSECTRLEGKPVSADEVLLAWSNVNTFLTPVSFMLQRQARRFAAHGPYLAGVLRAAEAQRAE